MPASVPADTARLSSAISIARVICIVGVIYVHAWTGMNGAALDALRGSGQEVLRWVLMEALGRSAVPLLGLISGWLVAGSKRTRNWSDLVARKARTILLPMILWNILAILFVSGFAMWGALRAPIPRDAMWVVQEVLILSRNPDINVQMPFLRDLFLCMVAAPLLVRLPTPLLLAIGAVAGLAHIFGLGPPVLMRASILFFFTLGIFARREGLADRAVRLPLWITILPFALLMPLRLALAMHLGREPAPEIGNALDLIARVAAALFFWRLAWGLAATGLGRAMQKVEPYAFFLFCMHLIIIWLGGPLVGQLTGPIGSPAYPVYLLIQPFLALGIAVAFARLLQRVAPPVAGILSGGRLGRTVKPLAPAPASAPPPSQA